MREINYDILNKKYKQQRIQNDKKTEKEEAEWIRP